MTHSSGHSFGRSSSTSPISADILACLQEAPLLVTDDDAIVLRLYQALLGRANVNALYTADASEALQICQTTPLSGLITDICKPVMSGLEMLEQIRAFPATAQMPTLVITASNSPANIQRARELNALVIPKPVDPHQLFVHLANLLRTA